MDSDCREVLGSALGLDQRVPIIPCLEHLGVRELAHRFEVASVLVVVGHELQLALDPDRLAT